MKKNIQHIISVLVVVFFVFIAFGSFDIEPSDAYIEYSTAQSVLADDSLTQAQNDSVSAVLKEEPSDSLIEYSPTDGIRDDDSLIQAPKDSLSEILEEGEIEILENQTPR